MIRLSGGLPSASAQYVGLTRYNATEIIESQCDSKGRETLFIDFAKLNFSRGLGCHDDPGNRNLPEAGFWSLRHLRP